VPIRTRQLAQSHPRLKVRRSGRRRTTRCLPRPRSRLAPVVGGSISSHPGVLSVGRFAGMTGSFPASATAAWGGPRSTSFCGADDPLAVNLHDLHLHNFVPNQPPNSTSLRRFAINPLFVLHFAVLFANFSFSARPLSRSPSRGSFRLAPDAFGLPLSLSVAPSPNRTQ